MITKERALAAFRAVKGEHDVLEWYTYAPAQFSACFIFRAPPSATELVLYVYEDGRCRVGSAPAPMTLNLLSMVGRADCFVKRLKLEDPTKP